MAPEEKANHIILRVLTIAVLISMLLCLGVFGYDRMRFEKQIQQSNDPDQIAIAFLQALMTNHLRFAKKLVVPEQKLRIDQWNAETQHQSINCPWDLDDVLGLEMVEWHSGGASYIDDRTVSGYYIDACSKNGYSIEVEGLIINHDGKNWIIMHWDKICESAKHGSSRVCYPTD